MPAGGGAGPAANRRGQARDLAARLLRALPSACPRPPTLLHARSPPLQNIVTPLLDQLLELGQQDETTAPTKRLAIIQVGARRGGE